MMSFQCWCYYILFKFSSTEDLWIGSLITRVSDEEVTDLEFERLKHDLSGDQFYDHDLQQPEQMLLPPIAVTV